MSSRSIPKALAVALLAIHATACYRYVPTQYDVIPAGENVRVWVTPEVKTRLEESMPIGDPILKGMIADKVDGGLSLRVPIVMHQEGFHSAPIFQQVSLAQRDILTIERRVFDRTGTVALTAGTIGAAGVVVFLIMDAYGDGPGDETCTDDTCTDLMAPTLPRVSNPGRRIPLFSIPIP